MAHAHRTIQFTFHTTKPGHYRWQCFVPCAAGWIDGFGGPMQTIGYMDGFLNVRAT
jgi:heme/copper-type cytochrome/quinol oxidase subunit 2